jgi:N-acetylglucosaminyl-diphospho-decaprenol L-rhamnosyltransferase
LPRPTTRRCARSGPVLSLAEGAGALSLNPDAEVRPGALQALVEFMESHPRAGACGARLLDPDGSLQPSCHPLPTPGREFWRLLFLERLWPRATYPMHRWDVTAPRRVEVIKGACLLLRRAALDQVGLLDESYFLYSEEVDLCHRLAQAGWELWWVPQATVVHHQAQSTRQAAERMYLQLYRSKVQFYHKVGGERLAQRFKRLLRLAYWPRLVVASLAAPFSPSLAAQAATYRRLLAELPSM